MRLIKGGCLNENSFVLYRYLNFYEDAEITPDDIDYDGFGIDVLDSFLNNL